MPDYTFYYSNTTSGNSDSISAGITYDEVQVMWAEYELSVDRDEEQRRRAEAELLEDKRKYPLFFIKDRIV